MASAIGCFDMLSPASVDPADLNRMIGTLQRINPPEPGGTRRNQDHSHGSSFTTEVEQRFTAEELEQARKEAVLPASG